MWALQASQSELGRLTAPLKLSRSNNIPLGRYDLTCRAESFSSIQVQYRKTTVSKQGDFSFGSAADAHHVHLFPSDFAGDGTAIKISSVEASLDRLPFVRLLAAKGARCHFHKASQLISANHSCECSRRRKIGKAASASVSSRNYGHSAEKRSTRSPGKWLLSQECSENT